MILNIDFEQNRSSSFWANFESTQQRKHKFENHSIGLRGEERSIKTYIIYTYNLTYVFILLILIPILSLYKKEKGLQPLYT